MAAAFGSRRASAGGNEMEAMRPHDVAICMMLRSYLCPDDSDPSPLSPLHALLGEALLREIRRRDEVAHPSLLGLLRNVQVRLPPPARPPPALSQTLFCHTSHPLPHHPASRRTTSVPAGRSCLLRPSTLQRSRPAWGSAWRHWSRPTTWWPSLPAWQTPSSPPAPRRQPQRERSRGRMPAVPWGCTCACAMRSTQLRPSRQVRVGRRGGGTKRNQMHRWHVIAAGAGRGNPSHDSALCPTIAGSLPPLPPPCLPAGHLPAADSCAAVL